MADNTLQSLRATQSLGLFFFFPGKQNKSTHMLPTLQISKRENWIFQKEKGYKDDIGPLIWIIIPSGSDSYSHLCTHYEKGDFS